MIYRYLYVGANVCPRASRWESLAQAVMFPWYVLKLWHSQSHTDVKCRNCKTSKMLSFYQGKGRAVANFFLLGIKPLANQFQFEIVFAMENDNNNYFEQGFARSNFFYNLKRIQNVYDNNFFQYIFKDFPKIKLFLYNPLYPKVQSFSTSFQPLTGSLY